MARIHTLFLFIALAATAPSQAQLLGGFGSGSTSSDSEGSAQLPLTLLHFGATPDNGQVVLQWATSYESGTAYFLVERTTDGRSFSPVGKVAAAGMSAQGTRREYSLLDPAPPAGSSFYRLKSVDQDGSFTYSDLVEVNQETGRQLLAFDVQPNPSTGSAIGLAVAAMSAEEPLFVEVLDAAGRQLLTRSVKGHPGVYLQLELRKQLPAGTYFLRMSQPSTGSHTSRLIVGMAE